VFDRKTNTAKMALTGILFALGGMYMPCTLVCLTPVIIASWPLIASFAVGVASALGFTAVKTVAKEEVEVGENVVEIELEGSSVQEGYTGQEIQFVKEGIQLTIKRNEFGRVVLCAKGSESKDVLRQKASSFIDKLNQTYAYHKAMTQLRTSGFNIVDETVGQDKEIHIKLRRV
jgi:hypothetical protein